MGRLPLTRPRLWVALTATVSLALACSTRSGEGLERLRSSPVVAGPRIIEGVTGEAKSPFLLQWDEDGCWYWESTGEQTIHGVDEEGPWGWTPGRPVLRWTPRFAAPAEARALAWTAGQAHTPSLERLAGSEDSIRLQQGSWTASLELDPEGRPSHLELTDGRSLAFEGWRNGAPETAWETLPGGAQQLWRVQKTSPGSGLPAPAGAPTAAWAEGVSPEVPVRRTPNGRILVKPTLGSGSDAAGWFLLDSCAAPLVLSPAMARDLGLQLEDGQGIRTLTGVLESKTAQGPELHLGPLTLPARSWSVLPLDSLSAEAEVELSGILGLDFFLGCRLVIPARGDHLLIEPSGPAPEGASYPVRFSGSLPCTRARIGGEEAWLAIDTGATDSLVLGSPLVQRARLLSEATSMRSVTLSGLGGRHQVTRAPLREGALAGVSLRGIEATMSRSREGVLAREEPAGLVGMRLLKLRDVILDLGGGWWSWSEVDWN